jgi:biopolymer transport protein TolR
MSAAFTRRLRRSRKLKAEINVVPYIDVMLVLLIIFMVTAPLLNLGVDIDLPQSDAKAVDQDRKPLTVTVDSEGAYSLVMPDQSRKVVDAAQLKAEVEAIVATNPELSVFVAGDATIDYQKVMDALAILQQAKVQKVGLMSKPTEAR